MKTILKYQLENGKIPFDEWFNKLDNLIKAKVLVRIERLKRGLYGQGILELKLVSGERIYFTEENNMIILLLTAGNKQRQENDIKTAELYFQNYKERSNNDFTGI